MATAAQAAGSPTAHADGSFDMVVIGGGPGGYVAAIRAAQLGLRVAIVERAELGGICLNWGCIPSKALLRSAEVITLIRHASDFGVSVGEPTPDYAAALKRCASIVDKQTKGVGFLMRKNNIEVVRGSATIASPTQVQVTGGASGDRTLATRTIVIATGSRVRPLPGVEIDGKNIVSSKEVWSVTDLPARVAILGGGPIGVEFATIYRAFGVDVTVVEMLGRIIPQEDEESSKELTRSLTRSGVKILTDTKVDKATLTATGVALSLVPARDGGAAAARTLDTDRVLVGAGFIPNSDNLGLETLGVVTQRGFIQIDDRMATNVPGIYAIGDVTGKLMLAHAASAMGHIVAEVIAGHETITLDYLGIPRCTYSSPQVASIGLTETAARELYGDRLRVGKFPFRPNGKAMALGEPDGSVKILADGQTGEILGAHLVGADVTELIGELSLAYLLESTPYELARAVHPHPTLSEALAEAALGVEGKPIHM